MNKKLTIAAFVACVAQSSAIISLSNGDLTVDISEVNGAIDLYQFTDENGVTSDYFNLGAPVSDYGFQIGTDTSTFAYANTSDAISGGMIITSVTSVGTGVQVSGVYTGAGTSVSFNRVYSLVAGQDNLKVTTTLTNEAAANSVRMFDTFDPDQGSGLGVGTQTYNDVYNVSGHTLASAYIDSSGYNHTAILYAEDGQSPVLAAGGPFQINNGSALNSFFDAPVDGEGTYADMGIHIGFEEFLETGESVEFTYFLATAETIEAVVDDVGTTVPEPTTTGLAAAGLLGLLVRRRR